MRGSISNKVLFKHMNVGYHTDSGLAHPYFAMIYLDPDNNLHISTSPVLSSHSNQIFTSDVAKLFLEAVAQEND